MARRYAIRKFAGYGAVSAGTFEQSIRLFRGLTAGWLGALTAFCAFTLPSTLLLIAFSTFSSTFDSRYMQAALHGRKLTAAIVVAQGVLITARNFVSDWPRAALVFLTARPVAHLRRIAFLESTRQTSGRFEIDRRRECGVGRAAGCSAVRSSLDYRRTCSIDFVFDTAGFILLALLRAPMLVSRCCLSACLLINVFGGSTLLNRQCCITQANDCPYSISTFNRFS